jgi:hypothetical protein
MCGKKGYHFCWPFFTRSKALTSPGNRTCPGPGGFHEVLSERLELPEEGEEMIVNLNRTRGDHGTTLYFTVAGSIARPRARLPRLDNRREAGKDYTFPNLEDRGGPLKLQGASLPRRRRDTASCQAVNPRRQ